MVPKNGRVDVWSEMLADDWEQTRAKLDWMSAPGMFHYVAGLLGGDWPVYIREVHLKPMCKRLRKRGLRMLTVGCGDARIERAALDRDWPISHITCAERDPALVEAAARNLDGVKARVSAVQFDMDAPGEPLGRFDVIFFCHSVHHCSRPEILLPFINDCLEPHGVIIGMDYLGAPRNQPPLEAMPLIRKVFDALPMRLRRNLVTDEVAATFRPIHPLAVATHDPSEAPRSADIRGMLFSLFPVVETRPLGGTLLRPILTQRAGNFVTEADATIIRLMQIIEELAITTSAVPSDDMFFVLAKSDLI